MAQFPDNVPTDFAGDATDFLKAKKDTFGALRTQYRSIAVADATTAGATWGIAPFRKGFRLSYGSKYHVTDVDTATNVTLNVGYLYSDTALTSDADAFASAVTTGQGGGLITFDEEEGLEWVSEGDGWITFALAAGPVSTAGTIKGQTTGCYDGVDSDN